MLGFLSFRKKYIQGMILLQAPYAEIQPLQLGVWRCILQGIRPPSEILKNLKIPLCCLPQKNKQTALEP